MTAMKAVVVFGIFVAIGATVLVITYEQIQLEGCACAHIEAFDKWNRLEYQDDAWDLSKRSRNAAKT